MYRFFKYPILLALICLSGALLVPDVALASVSNCQTGQLPATVSGLSANVPSGLAAGSVIPGSDRMLAIAITCGANATATEGTQCAGTPNWDIYLSSGGVPTATAIPGVYTTSLLPAGIGYRILDSAGQPMMALSNNRHDTGVRFGGNNSTQDLFFHFQLVKVSDSAVVAGTISLNMQISCNGNEWANKNASGSTVALRGDVKPIVATCALANPDTRVNLPPVSVADFSPGVGGSAGNASGRLVFYCDASADARANFTDASDPGNATDIIGLAASSTASGIGVRLTTSAGPIIMSPNADVGTAGTQFPLTNPNSNTLGLALNFNAEYVRTGDVLPGSVTTQVLITISYN